MPFDDDSDDMGDLIMDDPNLQPPDQGGAPNMGDQPDSGDFDADFDPGVSADEETDPKKFIQQLTGKLSQSLRKYNSGQAQPDADLNKYVAGMVVKASIENLQPDDVEDIKDKLDKGEDFTMGQDGEQEPVQDNGEGEMPQPDGNMGDNQQRVPQMGEGVTREAINELFQDLTNPDRVAPASDNKNRHYDTFASSPYTLRRK